MLMVSIRDTVADKFVSGISLEINKSTAIRAFATLLVSERGVMHSNPQDFDLVLLGEFDADSGSLVPSEHTKLINGLSAVNMITKGENNG